MQIFSYFQLNPAGRTDVVGGPHAARGPQVARDCLKSLSDHIDKCVLSMPNTY